MAFAAEDRAADLWLEWYLIVLTAMVANDLEFFGSVIALGSLFGAALCAALRSHQIPLIKNFLFLFGEKESLFALNANGFDIRHSSTSLLSQ